MPSDDEPTEATPQEVETAVEMIPDGATESETERDGVLSYAAEWHAFATGVYYGLLHIVPNTKRKPPTPDVRKEPHYYHGGYVIGWLLKALCAAVSGSYAIGVLAP